MGRKIGPVAPPATTSGVCEGELRVSRRANYRLHPIELGRLHQPVSLILNDLQTETC